MAALVSPLPGIKNAISHVWWTPGHNSIGCSQHWKQNNPGKLSSVTPLFSCFKNKRQKCNRRVIGSGRSLCMISGNADLASPIVTGPELAVKAPSSEEIMHATAGMGALLDGYGGCVFRVWAPHAESARVVIYDGDQPGAATWMTGEAGFWSARLPGVSAGTKYHFVFSEGGVDFERRDAQARQTDYDSNACYITDPSFPWSPFIPPTWDKLNIYQLQVAAFTGKWVTTPLYRREEGGGTFAALEAKLGYIKSLGFTAIQMLPIHEFCGSWGYNPRLLFAIHPPYGTPHDLRRLVDAAHGMGLAVIFDVVLNHGATRMNSLWAYDGWNPDNKGGLYFDGGSDTSFGKGFAWWRREVGDMIYDAAAMFLKEYNGDGLRFDCVHVMPEAVLKRVTGQLHQNFPGKILIAEVTPETPHIICGVGFDSTWMHSSFYDMRAFMQERRSLRKLESLLNLHPGYGSPTQCVKYFLGSHDQTGCRKNGDYDPSIQGVHRFAVDLHGGRSNWDARAISRMWYGCQVAACGIPMTFMGSEMHHSGWWGVEDRGRMIDWDLAEDGIGVHMTALVRSGNKLRESSPALTRGGFRTVHWDDGHTIIAFRRESKEQSMLVVVNASGNQWEAANYGVKVGGGNMFREKLCTQSEDFGGWAGAGNEGREVQVHEDKIFINVPKWSLSIFELV